MDIDIRSKRNEEGKKEENQPRVFRNVVYYVVGGRYAGDTICKIPEDTRRAEEVCVERGGDCDRTFLYVITRVGKEWYTYQ